MRKSTAVLSLIVLFACLIPISLVRAEEAEETARPAGEEIFLESKCAMCHTVASAGIGELRAEDDESDVALPPDLSETGSSRTPEWLGLYLQKKEAIEGTKHKKKFKGSDEERTLLVEWLSSLKAADGDSTTAVSVTEPAAEGTKQCSPACAKSCGAKAPAAPTDAPPASGE